MEHPQIDPARSGTGNSAGATQSLAPAADPAARSISDGAVSAALLTAALSGDGTDAEPPAAPPGYEVFEEVGRGGMGLVYRAREIALNRYVAIKFLQTRFAADGAAAARFVEEAQITGQLQHPGIPPIHRVGTLPNGRPYLVMKLIKGRTLEEALKRRPTPTSDRGQLLAVFEQICQAVASAHSRKVIHRDLKPANVMVGSFGEVQVMDWGLAKTLTAPQSKTEVLDDTRGGVTEVHTRRDSEGWLTQAGSMLGTPAFVPPEQAGGEADKIDERSDVFGLGAILCVILTGKPPYVAKDADTAKLMAIRGQLADCLARLDACAAEPELVALCKRCLAADPADRPRDAGLVARAVADLRVAADERARRAELEKVRAEGEARAAEVRTAEQRKRRKVQAALGLSFTALVILGGAFGWWTQEQARERRNQAEREVREAVQDAVARYAQARGAGRDLNLWAEARAAALQAEARADAAAAPSDVRQRVHDLLGEIEQVEKNRRLAAALLEIHAGMGDTLTLWGDQDFATAADRYVRAFRDYGVDLFQLSAEAGAELLRNLGSDVCVELAAAIDDWGYLRFYLAGRKLTDTIHLFRVTQLLDPDPMRNRIRALVAAHDDEGLNRLATDLEPAVQPSQTVNLVAVYLYWFQSAGGQKAAGQFLQRAQPHHPGDFQINHNLAFFLIQERRYTAALPYCGAAVAVRPRSPAAWDDYARALLGLGRKDEAAAIYRRICVLAPNALFAREELLKLVKQKGDQQQAEAVRKDLIRCVWEALPNATDPLTFRRLAATAARLGIITAVVTACEKAVQLDPNDDVSTNKLAWMLATGPDGVRDGRRAVELGTKACELTAWKRPLYVDTLAAAYAEVGDFDKAVALQKQALAVRGFEIRFGDVARRRLALYLRKTPFRSVVGPTPTAK